MDYGLSNLSIPVPCISWEDCTEDCGRTTIAIWPNGKAPGEVTECIDCGAQNSSVIFWATTN